MTFFNTQETFGSTRIIKRTKFKKLKKKKQTEEKKVTYKIMFLIYSFRQISSVNPLIFLIHSKLSFQRHSAFSVWMKQPIVRGFQWRVVCRNSCLSKSCSMFLRFLEKISTEEFIFIKPAGTHTACNFTNTKAKKI